MADWDPQLYHRFRRYRAEPFEAILARLELGSEERIVDLGCGTGEHLAELVRRTARGTGVGVDSSPAMIAAAKELLLTLDGGLAARLRFVLEDLRSFQARRAYSLVFSNAALQWTQDHRPVLEACYQALEFGGRLVMQIPANEIETAQRSMLALASSDRWHAQLSGARLPGLYVLPLEDYRRMLAEIGFVDIDCYYRNFEHPMASPGEVIEWSRATSMRPFLDALEPDDRARFEADLLTELERGYGSRGPLIFTFRRLFLWAHRPAL
ncbi:MAG TPA: methyltransferase domain-containing protein [Candidatus Binataceae bacterium]|nr:methyltransferase domain-containing protein [Candidatus Binataceae bacterium]